MENPQINPFTGVRIERITPGERAVQLQTDLDIIWSRYGVVVELSKYPDRRTDRLSFGRSISHEPVAEMHAAEPVHAIRWHLALYAPEYIHALGLRSIRPVRNLQESHFILGRIPEVGGIPVPKKGLMYLDVKTGHEIYVSEGLHHELSHFSDEEFSGLKGRRRKRTWVELNPKGESSYKVNPQYFSNRDVGNERPDGFASFYGSFSLEEDRAEVAKLIVTMGGTPYLRDLMGKDEVLKAKILAMLSYFNEKSGGKISEGFLDDLERKIVNEDYWDKMSV